MSEIIILLDLTTQHLQASRFLKGLTQSGEGSKESGTSLFSFLPHPLPCVSNSGGNSLMSWARGFTPMRSLYLR